MKRLLLFFLLFTSSVLTFAQVHVRGYYRKNGTYVRPHERTRPNHTITDNYSYPGNYNPNTGRVTGSSHRTTSSSYPVSATYGGYSSNLNTGNKHEASANTTESMSITNSEVDFTNLYALVEPNAALKAAPDYSAISKYAIPKESIVRIKKHNDNYYLAEVDGYNGYVCTCQVKKIFTKR